MAISLKLTCLRLVAETCSAAELEKVGLQRKQQLYYLYLSPDAPVWHNLLAGAILARDDDEAVAIASEKLFSHWQEKKRIHGDALLIQEQLRVTYHLEAWQQRLRQDLQIHPAFQHWSSAYLRRAPEHCHHGLRPINGVVNPRYGIKHFGWGTDRCDPQRFGCYVAPPPPSSEQQ